MTGHTAERMMARRIAVLGTVFLTFCLAGGAAFGAEDEAQLVQPPATGMKSGQLTAKHDKSVEIDGGPYAFHLKIVFADDEGRPREWKEFEKGDYVQFHLKQGQIDFLILELPK